MSTINRLLVHLMHTLHVFLATLKVDKEAAKRFIKSALWTDEGMTC